MFGEGFVSSCSKSRLVVSADVISSEVGLGAKVVLGRGPEVVTTCSLGEKVGGGAGGGSGSGGGGRGGGGGGGGGSVDRRAVWKCLTCLSDGIAIIERDRYYDKYRNEKELTENVEYS